MNWEDMSPGAMKGQLHAIAQATEVNVALLRSALGNLDALAIELGELLKGGNKFSPAGEARSHLQSSVHNWLTHTIEGADAAADVIRASADVL